MTHAEVCPICMGSGKVKDPNSTATESPCHGCGGRGWVEVSDPPTPYPYYPCQAGGVCYGSCLYCPWGIKVIYPSVGGC